MWGKKIETVHAYVYMLSLETVHAYMYMLSLISLINELPVSKQDPGPEKEFLMY